MVEISPVVLEKLFENFINVFLIFINYLPFEKSGALYVNKLASPSPQDALCQVWLKWSTSQVILKKRMKISKVYDKKRLTIEKL